MVCKLDFTLRAAGKFDKIIYLVIGALFCVLFGNILLSFFSILKTKEKK